VAEGMRMRATVAYDGTDYGGFQRQANAPSVQAELEAAVARVTQEEGSVLAAGRTDAGVHAVGQVIAFDTGWSHGVGNLQRALNAALPPDIAIREVCEVPSRFHPRYDARSRRYRYTLNNTPVRCPLSRRYSVHVSRLLDVAAMQRTALSLVGEHDFATFGRPPQGHNTVRRVVDAEWSGEPACLTFDIEANAFLYRMVRSVVGTLLLVGQGQMQVEEFVAVMEACDRSMAGPTALPHGLCLMEVKY
jgi:tRNA pseudouridine38-40 synthase